MTNEKHTVCPLDAKRREQTPQALARLVVVGLFIGLWFVLWLARMPMPTPFLVVLLVEALFFLLYWRTVFLLSSARAVERAQYTMLGAEIVFHTTMVYFLGSISWLGPFAYVFGLIFTNTFLDLRRGLVYTGGASLAFTALILLEATGTVPHYVYLEQGALRYTDARFVATTIIGGVGVFFSIYLWVNWVGHQLRRERDAAVRAQEEVLGTRAELERANAELEERVIARTVELERANAALAKNETKFRSLAETVNVAVFILRGEKMLYVNSAAEALSGYTQEELLEMNFWDAVHPEVQETMRTRGLAKQRGEPGPKEREVKIVTKAGQERWVEFRVSTIMFEGEPAILGAAFDITERRQAEEALRESEARYRWLLEGAPYAMVIANDKGRIVMVNAETEKLFKYDRIQLIGEPLEILMPERFQEVHLGHRAGYLENLYTRPMGMSLTDLVGRRSDGSEFPVDINLSGLKTEGGALVTAVIRDITEHKQAEKALQEQARRDPLTNLLNRRAGLVAMEEQLAQAKSVGGQFAVLVIDIDRFKAVNDVFGHEAGDNALIRLGLIMAELVGEEGVACRMGGDEFEIGLEGAGLYQAVLRGEELRAALQRSLEASSAEGGSQFMISVGVACYPQDGATMAALGRCADLAMYAAKAGGGDATRAWSHLAPRQAA